MEAGGVRATLNDVRVLPRTVFDSPVESPDNIFVATDLTFENVSDEPLAISSLLEFVLKNEEGYSASQTMHTQQRQLSEGEISTRAEDEREIVYEVPPDSRGLQLDYRPFLREDTHTWYIGDAEALPKVKAPQAKVPQAEAPQTKAAQTARRQTTSSSASAAQDPAGSESELIEAAVNYYQAVDQEDWAYTYDNLDSQTRSMFTEEEWYAKNKWYADNEGLELSTINVVVNGPTSEPVVSVTIYRTFTDGTSITRDIHSSPRRAASGSTASPRKRSASSCRASPTRSSSPRSSGPGLRRRSIGYQAIWQRPVETTLRKSATPSRLVRSRRSRLRRSSACLLRYSVCNKRLGRSLWAWPDGIIRSQRNALEENGCQAATETEGGVEHGDQSTPARPAGRPAVPAGRSTLRKASPAVLSGRIHTRWPAGVHLPA